MKYTSQRAFEKHLNDAAPDHLANVYLVISEDPYERQHAEKALVSLLKQPEHALTVFEGGKVSGGDIMQELRTLSMFGERRAVVIRRGEKLQKGVIKTLQDYFEEPDRDSVLAIVLESVNRATNFYKKGEKVGVVVDFPKEKPWEKERTLTGWIQGIVQEAGYTIESQAVQMLIHQTGLDRSFIEQELQKLYCFLGERKHVTAQDVGKLCMSLNVETAWQMGDAIFQKDVVGALSICRALMDEGNVLIGMLRQLRYQFVTSLQMATLHSRHEVAQLFPQFRGQNLERRIQQAQQYGASGLKRGLLLINGTELEMKQVMIDHSHLAERLILKLTVASQ